MQYVIEISRTQYVIGILTRHRNITYSMSHDTLNRGACCAAARACHAELLRWAGRCWDGCANGAAWRHLWKSGVCCGERACALAHTHVHAYTFTRIVCVSAATEHVRACIRMCMLRFTCVGLLCCNLFSVLYLHEHMPPSSPSDRRVHTQSHARRRSWSCLLRGGVCIENGADRLELSMCCCRWKRTGRHLWYAYIHIYVYVCICVYIYSYTYIYMYIHVYILYINIHVYAYRTSISIYLYIFVYAADRREQAGVGDIPLNI